MTIKEIETESKLIVDQIKVFSIYKTAKNICLYLPTEKEVNVFDLLTDSLQNSRNCFVPLIMGDDLEFLLVESLEDLQTFKKNKWNILEPPIETLDKRKSLFNSKIDNLLIIAPGLAFDIQKNRMGKGKGYYDKFIKRLRKENIKFETIAVSFSTQIVKDVPMEEFDEKMNYLALPDQIL